MTLQYTVLIFIVIAYILGSIPTAVWIGKKVKNIDIREHGSKNAGATNTFRVLGKKYGITVLIIDALKGFIPLFLAKQYLTTWDKDHLMSLLIIMGLAAVIGHIFPVFAQFRGGKGVATLLGVVIALSWKAALVSIVVFLVLFLSFKIVSLGSMIGGICFALSVNFLVPDQSIYLKYFSVFLALLLLFTHRKNIKRLLRKEENKINISKKNKTQLQS